jgi:hypothetical protein
MANAYDTLKANSSLTSGTAWELLNNPAATGAPGNVYLSGESEADITSTLLEVAIENVLSVDIKNNLLVAEIENQLSLEIQPELKAEI